MRRPDWAEMTDTIAGVPALPGGSAITVEPGGAVELSGPPMADCGIDAIADDRPTSAAPSPPPVSGWCCWGPIRYGPQNG